MVKRLFAILAAGAAVAASVAGAASAETGSGTKDRVGMTPYGAPITHAQVMQLLAGARAEAERRHVADMYTIVVVDPEGEIVYAEKAEKSNNIAVRLDWKKARSAALYGIPTSHFEDVLKSGDLSESIGLPDAEVQAGGIPVIWRGRIIGAVGVGGAFSANDVAIAEAGIAAVK